MSQDWGEPRSSPDGQPASPLPVPSSLPALKGIRRTPSAGILSALAVASSRAATSGSSPATCRRQQYPCDGTYATSFAVCNKPLFPAAGASTTDFDIVGMPRTTTCEPFPHDRHGNLLHINPATQAHAAPGELRCSGTKHFGTGCISTEYTSPSCGNDVLNKQSAVEPSKDSIRLQENESAAAPRTWWAEDGYCYHESIDGWRYWWDESANAWQPHCYVGAGASEVSVQPAENAASADTAPITAGSSVEYHHLPVTAESINLSDAMPSASALLSVGQEISQVATTGATSHAMGSSCSDLRGALSQQPVTSAVRASAPNAHELHLTCGFAKFSFGGRLLLVSPTGMLQLHSLPTLPRGVLQPIFDEGNRAVHSAGNVHQMLASFPGPLGKKADLPRLSKFVAARIEACVASCEEFGDHIALRTLWRVVGAKVDSVAEKDGASIGAALVSPADKEKQAFSGLNSALLYHQGPDLCVADQEATLFAVQKALIAGDHKAAIDACIKLRLWPLALIIAKLAGPTQWDAIVENWVAHSVSPMTSLSTFCLMTCGFVDRAIPEAGDAVQLDGILENWEMHASSVLAARHESSGQALLRLGSLLLCAGRLSPAHACFVLADMALEWADSSQPRQFALVGTSHVQAPRSFASLAAILRSEMYAWSCTVGNAGAVSQHLSILPYKLLHAQALAEMGLLSQAAEYCAALSATFQNLGNRAPPGLLVCRAALCDFHDRIRYHATARKVSLGNNLSASGLASNVGKLLDRGISALMGGDSKSASHSRSSSIGERSARMSPWHSRRQSTTSPTKLAAPGSTSMGSHGDAGSGASLFSGIVGRVSSFKSIVGGGSANSAAATPPNEPENLFYYDNELKIWREKGKDPPQVQQQLVPPPTEFHRISTPSSSHCTLIHQGTGRYAVAIPLAASSNIAASTVPQSSFLPEAANWTAPTRGANTAPNGFSDVQLQ